MDNITINPNEVQFISTITGNVINGRLYEPKWDIGDEQSIHIYTDAGIYYININQHTINGANYTSSIDLITYLNSL